MNSRDEGTTGGPPAARRRSSGRRAGESGTRDGIRAAAARQFAELGYSRASIRSIAREARVDPALVSHFFGTKDKLFVAVIELPFDPATVIQQIFAGDEEKLGDRLAVFLLAALEQPASRWPMVGLLRAAAAEPEAAEMVRDLITGEVLARIVAALGPKQAELRANLVASQVLGLITARYILGVEPLASLPPRAAAAAVAPHLQRYLTAPVDTRGGDQR